MTQITLRDRLYSLVFETAEIEDNLITNIDRVVDAVLAEIAASFDLAGAMGRAEIPSNPNNTRPGLKLENVIPASTLAVVARAVLASLLDPEDLRSPTPPSAQDTTRAKP